MTQGNPVQWGQQGISDRISHDEQIIEFNNGGYQVGYQQAAAWTIATYTMPFDGQLTAHVVHTGAYDPGLMAITFRLTSSTPAPNDNYWGRFSDFVPNYGAYDYASTYAQWRDLAKGQVVSVVGYVFVDLGNVNWRCSVMFGWLRAARV